MSDNKDKLVVLWTSADREVALNMVFMYTINAKLRGWWKEVTLVVWGPSAKLLSEDKDLRDRIGGIKGSGVEILACKACTDDYGITESLEKLGIKVIYMGESLTCYLKDDIKIITF